jgi:hypothetical protein
MDLSRLSYLAPLVLVPLLLRSLMRGKHAEAQAEGGAQVMRYGAPWRGAVWAGACCSAGVALLPLFVPMKPGDGWIFVWMTGGFAALTLLLGVEVYRLSFLLTPQGIERRSPWRRAPLFFAWAELRSVSYLSGAQALELRHRDGRSMNVSQYLQGFASLQALLERHAPPGVLGHVTRGQLPTLR